MNTNQKLSFKCFHRCIQIIVRLILRLKFNILILDDNLLQVQIFSKMQRHTYVPKGQIIKLNENLGLYRQSHRYFHREQGILLIFSCSYILTSLSDEIQDTWGSHAFYKQRKRYDCNLCTFDVMHKTIIRTRNKIFCLFKILLMIHFVRKDESQLNEVS